MEAIIDQASAELLKIIIATIGVMAGIAVLAMTRRGAAWLIKMAEKPYR